MRRSKFGASDLNGIRVYADEEEKIEMDDCHVPSIEQFKLLLSKVGSHGEGRALEVACGDGRLTIDLL